MSFYYNRTDGIPPVVYETDWYLLFLHYHLVMEQKGQFAISKLCI